MTRTPGQIANEEVSIVSVCRLVGMSMPDLEYIDSPKMYCPFGEISHSDGGDSKSFRTYASTNTAHCFACTKTWNPVTLYMDYTDLPYQEAARSLLEQFDIRTDDPDDRWKSLTAPATVSVNQSELAEALKMFCRRIEPRWEERQFEPEVAEAFTRCMALMDLIASVPDVERWRTAAKTYMEKVLNG